MPAILDLLDVGAGDGALVRAALGKGSGGMAVAAVEPHEPTRRQLHDTRTMHPEERRRAPHSLPSLTTRRPQPAFRPMRVLLFVAPFQASLEDRAITTMLYPRTDEVRVEAD